jgi:hypothetical protein
VNHRKNAEMDTVKTVENNRLLGCENVGLKTDEYDCLLLLVPYGLTDVLGNTRSQMASIIFLSIFSVLPYSSFV